MNFLQRIKNQMNDSMRYRGAMGNNEISIDSRALAELIKDYEKLDSYHRALQDDCFHKQQQLFNIITAIYEKEIKTNGNN